MSDSKIIEITAKTTAKEVITELKKQGLLKENKQTPFQKTETLLYNYHHFIDAVNDKYDQILHIRENGIQNKSTDITSFSGIAAYDVKNDYEKIEEKIEAIENSIQVTKSFINIIDSALAALKDDQYFDIIKLKYFERKNGEEIAEYFNSVEASTISRNKNRLINFLQIRFFSDEVICQLFN